MRGEDRPRLNVAVGMAVFVATDRQGHGRGAPTGESLAALERSERQTTLGKPEVRGEGIAMLDPRGDMTDLGLPEEGTEGHLTLLIAKFLADQLRKDRRAVVGFAALCAHAAGLIAEHRHHWRKDASAPGADRVLTEMTITRLEALRLVRRVPDGIQPLPAIARYALAAGPEVNTVSEPALF